MPLFSREIDRAAPSRWGIPMTVGILLIVGGILALAANVLTTLVSIFYIGAMLLIVGVLEIVAAFRARHKGPFLVYLLAGLLALVTGALFFRSPLTSLATLTLLIAGYLFASGMFRGVMAVAERYARWGWDLAYAILAILLGVYVTASWPLSAFWVLGTAVAAEIIARGITIVAASRVLREIDQGTMRGGYAHA